MDIVTLAKNVGSVLGGASGIAYIAGYLALRARAFALGTDPAFELVDEGYVFAGFRFVFISLVVLLIATPAVLLARAAAIRVAHAAPRALESALRWLVLAVLAIATLATLGILSVSGVLLAPDAGVGSGLAAAALGGAGALRMLLTFAVITLFAISAIWLRERLANHRGGFEWTLALVVALQTIMLPIYHGALFADRRVRVLADVPATVQGLVAPIAIVDRTAGHVTLLGRDRAGARRLATVRLADLNGAPIRAVMGLDEFVQALGRGTLEPAATRGSRTGFELMRAANAAEHGGDESRSTGSMQGFFASLLDQLRITLDAIGSLGSSEVEAGEIWIVALDPDGRPGAARRIGDADDLSWPVAADGDGPYYALRRGALVRIDDDDLPPVPVVPVVPDVVWLELLGVRPDGAVLGLVGDGTELRPATLLPNGRAHIDDSALTADQRTAIARLTQGTRGYAGNRTVHVDRSERGGRGFDVYLTTEIDTWNLSDCADDTCGQASLTPDLRYALFVRESRY